LPHLERTTSTDRTDTIRGDRRADRRRRAARSRRAGGGRPAALLVGAAIVLGACAPGGDVAAPAADPSGDDATRAAPVAEIDGPDLILRRGEDRTTLASLDDGELVHAIVRPGDRGGDAVTVLALARTDGRYELRYVTRTPEATTDLYGFPSRLQVDPDSARVVDVPTLPVWAPDGSALAWLEWGTDGTRLRTVGWFDHDAGTNPSDDQATYRLDDVPAGSQLEAWEVDEDGTAVLLVRTDDGERWRLRLEPDGPSVASAATV
jgi:hypothetical protein